MASIKTLPSLLHMQPKPEHVNWLRPYSPLANFQKQEHGVPLPKFGEWDVNNPASAEGFTVIFSKARDEKKGNGAAGSESGSQVKKNGSTRQQECQNSTAKKRFCCF